MKRIVGVFGSEFEKPYIFGGRREQKYNLKSKRWKGLIQIPDEGYLAMKRAKGLRQTVGRATNDLRIARKCLNFQDFRCNNKHCLCLACPLNSKYGVKE
jgi:hypothetical protein